MASSKNIQTSFFKSKAFSDYNRSEHGGILHKGKRKLARPVATKRPMHLVLRASKARGVWSFLNSKNRVLLDKVLQKTARRFQVKIQQVANSGNHLHLVVVAKTREGFQSFLRTLTALLARKITGAKKGAPKGKFWDALAYTRVVTWGRELIALKRYLLKNDLEAVGFLNHEERAIGFAEALARRGLKLVT